MKITGNEELVKQLTTGQTGKAAPPAKGVFGTLLREVAKTENNDTGQSHSIQGPSSIRGVSFIPLLDTNPVSIPDRVEKFLDLLDAYRNMLANPHVSLKAIDPVMQKIASEKSSLQKALQGLPEGDHLRGILNQVLVAASLEEIKFNKGDYNPA